MRPQGGPEYRQRLRTKGTESGPPFLFNEGQKAVRQRGADIQAGARRAGGNNQPGGVEEEPPEAHGPAEFFVQGKIPVFVVPQDGVPRFGQVAADLMHAAGSQFQFQEGKAAVPRQTFPGGPGLFFLSPDFQTPFNEP